MARYFKAFILCSVFLLVACQEGREAGDLWGQWRMTGSDTNYISFSGSVTLFRNTAVSDLGKGQTYGNFQHIGDSLWIQCYSAKGEVSDTITVEEVFGFKPFNNIRLKIETLDKDCLVLSKDGRTWSFYKY